MYLKLAILLVWNMMVLVGCFLIQQQYIDTLALSFYEEGFLTRMLALVTFVLIVGGSTIMILHGTNFNQNDRESDEVSTRL